MLQKEEGTVTYGLCYQLLLIVTETVTQVSPWMGKTQTAK